VWRKGPSLVPTFTAFAVINLMLGHLSELVDYDFTARMEDELDTIARGEREAGPWLAAFYFGPGADAGANGSLARAGLKSLVDASIEQVAPQEVSRFVIGTTSDGEDVAVRVGRFGPYVQVGDSDRRASVPDDLPPDELTVGRALELLERSANGSRVLGQDAETGKPVYVKSGRFGPYVQLGDPELTEKGNVKRGGKAKMASLWPSMSPETLTLQDALMLLSFPREVGRHPESGEPITAQDGRFGPYLKMGSETRSLSEHELLATIDLEGAVELFKQPKPSRRGGSRAVLAELGQHPQSGDAIVVKDGRYGAYVTDGVVNASVPKGSDPATVTLDKALELLVAREQKLRDQGKDPRAPKAKKGARRKTPPKRRKK
jgi:DNA topoisomerase-1